MYHIQCFTCMVCCRRKKKQSETIKQIIGWLVCTIYMYSLSRAHTYTNTQTLTTQFEKYSFVHSLALSLFHCWHTKKKTRWKCSTFEYVSAFGFRWIEHGGNSTTNNSCNSNFNPCLNLQVDTTGWKHVRWLYRLRFVRLISRYFARNSFANIFNLSARSESVLNSILCVRVRFEN